MAGGSKDELLDISDDESSDGESSEEDDKTTKIPIPTIQKSFQIQGQEGDLYIDSEAQDNTDKAVE